MICVSTISRKQDWRNTANKVTACNTSGYCETVFINITVSYDCISTPIDAIKDYYTTYQSTSIQFNPLINDSGSPFNVSNTDNHYIGTLNTYNGVWDYTPANGFTGVDTLYYTICNAQGNCDTAPVCIEVLPTCSQYTFTCAEPGTMVSICPEFCNLRTMRKLAIFKHYSCSIDYTGGQLFHLSANALLQLWSERYLKSHCMRRNSVRNSLYCVTNWLCSTSVWRLPHNYAGSNYHYRCYRKRHRSLWWRTLLALSKMVCMVLPALTKMDWLFTNPPTMAIWAMTLLRISLAVPAMIQCAIQATLYLLLPIPMPLRKTMLRKPISTVL